MGLREHPVEEPAAAWSPTPLRALGEPEIASEAHFVRDHFPVPDLDPLSWSVRLEGAHRHLALTAAGLATRRQRSLRVVLECAGNRRREFSPPAPGLQWGAGAVGEAVWSGVTLGPLLVASGIPATATHVVLEGADHGSFAGLEGEHRFARSLPLEKALHGDVLLALAMGGEPIPVRRGGPVRAIVPGWYATDSVKWLARIAFADGPCTGPFEALEYRLGQVGAPPEDGERLTALALNSLITDPAPESVLPAGRAWVRGIAWGGVGGVGGVEVALEGGGSWAARLGRARGPYARRLWECECALPPGRHRLTSCAWDLSGSVQPVRPAPNAGGYANNAVHRVEVRVRS